MGRLWGVGGGTTPFSYTSGNAFAFHPDAPGGSLVDTFRNRILVSGVSAAGSSLYMSGELNGLDWTTGAQSTSPMTWSIGGVDDILDISCLMGIYNDVYIIGKLDSLWAMYGFDQDDLIVRLLNGGVGCAAERSVVHMDDGRMIWLGFDGFYELSGGGIRPISQNIDALAKKIGSQARLAKQGRLGRRNFVAFQHKGRYWFSYVLNSGTSFVDNNAILVYEGDGVWTQFDNLNISSFANYSGTVLNEQPMHFGNSNSNGYIYIFGYEGGLTAGSDLHESSYTASFRTNKLNMGDSSAMKIFETLYVDFYPTPEDRWDTGTGYDDFRMPVSYRIDSLDDTTKDVIITTIVVTGTDRLYSAKVNLGQSGVATAPKGNWIDFKFSITADRNPFLIHGIKVRYSKLKPL